MLPLSVIFMKVVNEKSRKRGRDRKTIHPILNWTYTRKIFPKVFVNARKRGGDQSPPSSSGLLILWRSYVSGHGKTGSRGLGNNFLRLRLIKVGEIWTTCYEVNQNYFHLLPPPTFSTNVTVFDNAPKVCLW